MWAMVLDQFGGPEMLYLAQIEKPSAAPGGVVIKVAFAGVNPADWKCREGWLSRYFDYQFPYVVGFDAAGIVTDVGAGVTRFRVGDRVVTASNQGRGERGTYAQYVASDQERVALLPDSMSLRHAASLPTAGMTAWEAVFDVANVKAGQKVLVNGGAGGTGSFAVQLAHMAGADVAATCGSDNLDYVRGLGATLAIDYRQGDVLDTVRAWAPGGVDAVIDTVGQGSLLGAIDIVRAGGIVVPITTLIADERLHDLDRAAERRVEIKTACSNFVNQSRQLCALVEAFADGRIHVPALTVLPLEEAAEAHRRVAAGHVCGKILLAVDASHGR